MRTIAFGLKNFATIPPSLKSGTTTLKELSFKTKDPRHHYFLAKYGDSPADPGAYEYGSITIDWTQQEAVRADMRRKVKRPLRKYSYPLDKQQGAGLVVMGQTERVCKDWARA